jgi:hypothetical protein
MGGTRPTPRCTELRRWWVLASWVVEGEHVGYDVGVDAVQADMLKWLFLSLLFGVLALAFPVAALVRSTIQERRR